MSYSTLSCIQLNLAKSFIFIQWSNMVQETLADFSDWTKNYPLVVVAGSPDITQYEFKVLPKYEVMSKIPYEHY